MDSAASRIQNRLPEHQVYPKIIVSQGMPEEVVEEVRQLRREKRVEDKQLFDGLEYCGRIIEERDYDSLLATMLMPSETRGHTFAMLALNAEVSVIRQKIKRNSGVTGIYQLQFWKEALEVLAGKRPGPIPRQPVLHVLRAYWTPDEIPMLMKLVEARQETLGDRPFETLAQLEYNCECIYATQILAWMNALKDAYSMRTNDARLHQRLEDAVRESAAFTRDTPLLPEAVSAQNVSRKMARALGILITLRATIPLLREGAVLLPKDCMKMHGLDEDAIARNANPNALRSLVNDLCMVSEDYVKAARAAKDVIHEQLRRAFIVSGTRVDHLLGEFKRCDYNVLDSRLQDRNPFVAWKLRWRNFRGAY